MTIKEEILEKSAIRTNTAEVAPPAVKETENVPKEQKQDAVNDVKNEKPKQLLLNPTQQTPGERGIYKFLISVIQPQLKKRNPAFTKIIMDAIKINFPDITEEETTKMITLFINYKKR